MPSMASMSRRNSLGGAIERRNSWISDLDRSVASGGSAGKGGISTRPASRASFGRSNGTFCTLTKRLSSPVVVQWVHAWFRAQDFDLFECPPTLRRYGEHSFLAAP